MAPASRLVVVPLLLSVACASLRGDDSYTIESNLRYRLSRGDLPTLADIGSVPGESRRALRLTDSEPLLAQCTADASHWRQDPLLFRFGHTHAVSTVGCREKSSPSMHAVFYRRPDGAREAWVHFDLHGPGNPLGHFSEVVRNRLTFGRTSEYDVYRGLVKSTSESTDSGTAPPPELPPRYDLNANGTHYVDQVFGVNAILAATASGVAGATLHNALSHRESYVDHIERNLARNGISTSIEYGTAALLGQEQGFHPSGETGFRKRATSALYHAFMVPGRDGDELAFPRIAAAFATPLAMRPLFSSRTDPWAQTAFLLSRYVARSYWAEFRPDIVHLGHKLRRQHAPQTPTSDGDSTGIPARSTTPDWTE